ncbi:MAG TPA: DUF5313 family protein [Jatrophihabitantaceae bacterium]
MQQRDVIRPNPVQWLRYAYVGTVSAKSHAWVLHDATCRTWILRHVARYFALVTPLIVPVMIFLPAPLSLRAMSCLVAVLTMMMFYVAFTVDSVERRVELAGYPHGTAARIREQRALGAQRATAARNRARQYARVHKNS